MAKRKLKYIKFDNEDSGSDHTDKKPKPFSPIETDLLLSLLMSTKSQITQTKSGMPEVHYFEWNEVAKNFNASKFVVKRTRKELQDWVSNIQQKIYRLSKFQKKLNETIRVDDQIPPLIPSPMPLEFSNILKKYAISLQLKLDELSRDEIDPLSLQLELDEASSQGNDPLSLQLELHEVADYEIDPLPLQVKLEELSSDEIDSLSTRDCEVLDSKRLSNSYDSDVNTIYLNISATEETPPAFKGSLRFDDISPMLKGQTHNNLEKNIVSKDSHCYNSTDSSSHEDEVHQRRREWHNICMEIKNEELGIKRKQSEFWSIMVNIFKENPKTFLDVANLSRAMDVSNSIDYSFSYPAPDCSDDESDVKMNHSYPISKRIRKKKK